MIGLGGWGKRDEKWGPYVRWRDGKIVRDDMPGQVGAHGPKQAFQLTIREPNHPITAGLPPVFMHVPDELYGWLAAPRRSLPCWPRPSHPRTKGVPVSTSRCCSRCSMARGACFRTAWGTRPIS